MSAANRLQKTCLTPREIEQKLVSAGVQPTAQRIAICQYVLCEADHPTAEEVKEWADANFPKLSLATVYNTLAVLVKAGLLKELRFPHTDKVVYDDLMTEHHHFLDEATGRIIDIEAGEVEVTPKLPKKFKVKRVDVLIRGTQE